VTTGVVPGRQPPQLDEVEAQRLDGAMYPCSAARSITRPTRAGCRVLASIASSESSAPSSAGVSRPETRKA